MEPEDDLRQQVIDRFGDLMPITDEELQSVAELKDILDSRFDDAQPAVMRVIFDGEPAICIVAHYHAEDGSQGLQALALMMDEHIIGKITDVHGDHATPVDGVTQGNSHNREEQE